MYELDNLDANYCVEVVADILYLDGVLKDMTIPAGYRCRFTSYIAAERNMIWLHKVMAEDDFIRAAITGNRYKIVGGITHYKIGG